MMTEDCNVELDRFDKQILEILTHEDANLNELSERINLSVSSVHRRIKNLIESQVMGQLKREINFNKLGFSLHILLQVSLSKHDSETFDKFLAEIEDIPEVTNAFLVTGQSADFILELVARNMDDYSEILLRRIGKIDSVVALHSSFVIKEYDVFNCYKLLNKLWSSILPCGAKSFLAELELFLVVLFNLSQPPFKKGGVVPLL